MLLPIAAPTLPPLPEPAPVALSAIGEAVARAVKRFDAIEGGIDQPELAPHPLDMAIDGAIIDEDIVGIGGVHQLVAAFDHAGANRQRFKDQEFGDRQGPYERLLRAAMLGDHFRFTRIDAVLHSWKILDDILKSPTRVHPYFEGTWGPDEAQEMIPGGWNPVGTQVDV